MTEPTNEQAERAWSGWMIAHGIPTIFDPGPMHDTFIDGYEQARADRDAEAAALREALRNLNDRCMPTHRLICASQPDEAPCICETGSVMERVYALLAQPEPKP